MFTIVLSFITKLHDIDVELCLKSRSMAVGIKALHIDNLLVFCGLWLMVDF